MTDIQQKLITAGIKNLKEFGYPKVNADNILTDIIYKGFFKSILIDNKGNGKQIDEAIYGLLKIINKAL